MGVTKLLEDEQGAGARIDRYDLIAEIASGGMATVYLGRLSGVGGFQRSFAIKRLHPHLSTNVDFVQMFFDEARLAALIRHPNVVPILEVGEGADGYYLVMEYIEGDTFASLLSKASQRGHRIPNAISLRIVIDMLHGLHAAHELKDEHGHSVGLVHRDVSPQNVLVGTEGITRITDFGVARAASALSETRSGQLKGKLAYMAPEQASGAEDVDRRADVFSAGVVLWEALAFRRLFKAKNEATTLSRVLNEPIVSPGQHNPGLPEGVAAACLQALSRDVQQRFASCADFAAALERAGNAAGQLATVKEVADYVQELVGADVESHRVAIRQWLQRRERSGSLPPSSARASMRTSSMPPSSRGSLPPPELSSVTQASPPPPHHPDLVGGKPPSPIPRGAVGKTPASQLVSGPASATHSGVIVTPARGRRRRSRLVVGVSLFVVVAGGAAWFLSRDAGPETTSEPPVVAASVPPAEPTAAPPASQASAEATATEEPASKILSSDELPEDLGEEEKAESAAASTKPRPVRSHPRRRGTRKPAKKKPDIDLQNPYQ